MISEKLVKFSNAYFYKALLHTIMYINDVNSLK